MAAMQRACEACGGSFEAKVKEVNRGGGRFCSRSCADTARGGRPSVPLLQRFVASRWVERPDGCFIWIGKTNAAGYGRIKDNRGVEVMAHRVAVELARGAIPPGMVVCHRCDTPACVNPEHLFVGTVQDNLRDMHEKGRARGNTSNHQRGRDGRFA